VIAAGLYDWLHAWTLEDSAQAAQCSRIVLWAPGLVAVLVPLGWGMVRRLMGRFTGYR